MISGSALAGSDIAPTLKENALGGKTTERQLLKERAAKHERTAAKSPFKASEVIREVSGTPKYYILDVDGNMYGEDFSEEGMATFIAYGENDEVYFYDIMPDAGFGTYAKGTLDGETVTLDLPQMLEYYDDYGYGFLLTLLKEENGSYEPVDGSAEFEVYDDGSLVMNLPGEEIGEYLLGLIFSDDYTYADLGYYSMVYTPLDEEVTSIPDGVTTETYYFNDGIFGYPVEVGYDNDHVYMQGLVYEMQSFCVVIGDLNGSVATIPQDEFIGAYAFYPIYTKAAVISGTNLMLTDTPVSLNVDKANKVITYSDNSPYLLINGGKEEINYLAIFSDLSLKTQDIFTGIPMNPFYLEFTDDYLDYYGYYSFMFTVPNVSIEGNVLLSKDLYYKIYVDGDLFEFEEDYMTGEYYGFSGTEVPFDFTNGNDFYMWGPVDREVGLYIDGITTVGVQTIYKYGDVVTESAIVTLNIETGDITEEGGSAAGVNSISSADVVSNVYYNLNGQRVNNPDNGIFIKKATLSNGEIITTKVIRR